MQKMKVTHYPLSNGARSILVAALVINIIATLAFIYADGSKPSLLIVPGIFLAVFALLLLVLRFRYTLLERYPYLVNLPAFTYRLGIQKNPETAGIVINRVFTVHAAASLFVSVLYLIFSTAILQQNGHLALPEIFVLVIVFVVAVFVQYRRIYMSFAQAQGMPSE